MDVLSPFVSVLSHSVRGLPRLRAPDIVPCIISFSRQPHKVLFCSLAVLDPSTEVLSAFISVLCHSD